MSNITEEDVMKYCYSRNLMLVTKESLEYMHRPIVIETMNKNAIPIEWIKKYIDNTLDDGNSQMIGFKAAIIKEMIDEWEKENEILVMPVSDNSTIPLDYLRERENETNR